MNVSQRWACLINLVAIAGCADPSGGGAEQGEATAETASEAATVAASWQPACGVHLTKPGTYVLDRDLVCSGPDYAITIESSGVTLDLHGYHLLGRDLNRTGGGIKVVARGSDAQVAISNGTLWGFAVGISLAGPGKPDKTTVTLKGITVAGSKLGVDNGPTGANGFVVLDHVQLIGNDEALNGAPSTSTTLKSSALLGNKNANTLIYASLDVHDSVVAGTGTEYGIGASRGGLVVENSKFLNLATGIGTWKTGGLQISGNEIHGTGTGIGISGSKGTVSSNIVTDNKLDISADKDSCTNVTWTKNTFKTTDASCVH